MRSSTLLHGLFVEQLCKKVMHQWSRPSLARMASCRSASSSQHSRAISPPLVELPTTSQLQSALPTPGELLPVVYHPIVQPHILPTKEELLAVHSEAYLDDFLAGTLPAPIVRRIGFNEIIHTETLVRRTLWECAGTLLTARLALQHGLAVNTAGGTHHAFPSSGSGYCVINDLAVTTEALLRDGIVQRVMIVDLDVHQGDGTARIFQGREDVYIFDFHSADNFPARKQPADCNIGLPDGTGDHAYLSTLSEHLAAALSFFRPDLVLFDAGVDPHVDDRLGRLSLTDRGLREREMLVLHLCLGEGIPVAGLVGGGYDQDLDVLADRHLHLHKAALDLWTEYQLMDYCKPSRVPWQHHQAAKRDGGGSRSPSPVSVSAVPFLRLYEVHLLSQGQPPRKGGSRPRSGRIRGEQPTMSLSILNQASCSPSHQPY
ncbi:uncharacterized protein SYNPCC7002_A1628-like [Convolutriloba macropyga]|uniref:uncharacterized protein SYNPCC7002_A1628-like n=1 Tax=Convolutriloba macropyga TaxID=536237 RepID=UPI003F526565